MGLIWEMHADPGFGFGNRGWIWILKEVYVVKKLDIMSMEEQMEKRMRYTESIGPPRGNYTQRHDLQHTIQLATQ